MATTWTSNMSADDNEFDAQMMANEFASAPFRDLTSDTRFDISETLNRDNHETTTDKYRTHYIKKLRQPAFIQNKQLHSDPSKWTVEERVGVEQLARLGSISREAANSLCRSLLPYYEPKTILDAVEKRRSNRVKKENELAESEIREENELDGRKIKEETESSGIQKETESNGIHKEQLQENEIKQEHKDLENNNPKPKKIKIKQEA